MKEKRISIRLNEEEYSKLEKLQQRLKQETGLRITLSDTIRYLIKDLKGDK